MNARRLKQIMVGTFVGVGGALVIGLAGRQVELPVLWQAPEFELTTQTGEALRTADLRGDLWVASFVFTNCEGVCPLITQRVAELRDRLRSMGRLGHDVRLVSFSVDPARDTPEALSSYAANFGASPPSEWAFLTGEPAADVRAMIQEGFHLTAMEPEGHAAGEHGASREGASYQIMHSPRLALVDRRGQVRATYDATETGVVDDVLEGLATLR